MDLLEENMHKNLHKKGLELRDVVPLAFHHTKPRIRRATPAPWKEKPAIINLHGLFGSHIMFHSLNRPLMKTFETDIYNVDLRNHGNSPRAQPYDYLTLSKDIIQFIRDNIYREQPGRPIYLIGFSLGGKVALLSSLSRQINVKKCISIDLPPYELDKVDDMFMQNFELLEKIVKREIKVRRSCPSWKTDILTMFRELPVNKCNPNGNNVALYFANGFLTYKPNNQSSSGLENDYLQYAVPLEYMPDIIAEIKKWPSATSLNPMMYHTKSQLPTLFMKGLHSSFIKNDYSLLKTQYPQSSVLEFDCGHTILMDYPKESTEAIIKFLSNNKRVQ